MFMDDTKGNICGRTDEAAALLGISVRTAGFDGQFDYLLVQPSANRAEDSEVQKMTRLYEDRYHRFNVKHFHEYAQREHGLTYSSIPGQRILLRKQDLLAKANPEVEITACDENTVLWRA